MVETQLYCRCKKINKGFYEKSRVGWSCECSYMGPKPKFVKTRAKVEVVSLEER